MKKIYLIICILFFHYTAFAQTICYTFRDSFSLAPIYQVNIKKSSTSSAQQSDKLGRVCLQRSSTFDTIQIVHTRYQTKQFYATFRDTTIYLTPKEIELEQVIVTGVAGSAKMKSTPFAIASVSQKNLWQSNASNVIELLSKSVPGLTTVTTGPNISKPIIRGLGYNRVLTLYDGMRQEGQQWGDEHGIEVDQYGINKAEVIKGPASLRYGSDAIAGVVNLIPALPNNNADTSLHGDAQTEYQTNHGLMGFSSSLHQKNSKHVFWQARLSGKMAGNYQNAIDGRVYNTAFKEWNGGLLIGKTYKKGWHLVHANVFYNLQEIPDGSRDSLSRAFTKQIHEAANDTISTRPLVPASDLFSYRITPLHQLIRHYRLYYKAFWQTNNTTWQILAGVQQNRRQEYNHPTQPTQPGLDVRLTTMNYDVAYTQKLRHQWELSGGINGMYQINKSIDATDFPIPDYHLLDVGTYLLLKKEINNITLLGGVRYDYRDVHWPDMYIKSGINNGFDGKVPAPQHNDTVDITKPFHRTALNLGGFSGSFGAAWNVSKSLTLKANAAKGYRSPNINEMAANGLDPGAHIYYLGNTQFKPETNIQADMGAFISTANLKASLELFSNHINNYIFLQKMFSADGTPLMLAGNNFTYQYQQGSAHIYGCEATVNWQPTFLNGFSVGIAVSIMNGINTYQPTLAQYGMKARYLPLIPPPTTTFKLRYTHPKNVGCIQEPYLEITSDIINTQNRFYAVDNTETATSGYFLCHLQWGCNILNKNNKSTFRLNGGINNIFNKIYQSHLNRLKYFEYFSASPNNTSGIYNMGFNAHIKLSYIW